MGQTIRWAKQGPIQFESAGKCIDGPSITPICQGIEILPNVEVSLSVRLTQHIEIDLILWNKSENRHTSIELVHPIDHRVGLIINMDPILKEEDQWEDEILRQLAYQITDKAVVNLTYRSKEEMISNSDMIEVYVKYNTWGGTTWCPIEWLDSYIKTNIHSTAP
jgi:hypothetical protein